MRFRRIVTAGALVAAVIFASCGSDPAQSGSDSAATSTSPGVDLSAVEFADDTADQTVKVNADDNEFKERYIEVKAGTKVTFRNDGRNLHNVLPVDERAFKAIETDDFDPGVEVTIKFGKAGDFPYYCSLHGTPTRGMTGAIRVVP